MLGIEHFIQPRAMEMTFDDGLFEAWDWVQRELGHADELKSHNAGIRRNA